MEAHKAKDLVVASAKSLRRKAKASEEETMEKLLHRTRFEHIADLSHLLHNVYNCHRPTVADYGTRRDLIRVFNETAKEIYGSSIESPVIEPYGSFVMDMFSAQSDLDLSINFKQNSVELPREEKIKILKKFAKKFRFLKKKGHVAGLESVFTAKVPIVKVIDHESKVECDFSVENRGGILKSQIIHIISGMDHRFQKLCVLLSLFFAGKDLINNVIVLSGIDEAVGQSLGDQLLKKPNPKLDIYNILGGFSSSDGVDPANIRRRIERKFTNWGTKNDEPLGWLFVTLLIKLKSVEKLWSKGLCASLYSGFWISRSWDKGIDSISIEDFTDQTQNFAGAVGEHGLSQIYDAIQNSISYLSDFFDGKKSGSDLIECLFHGGVSTMPPSTFIRPTVPSHDPAKRSYPEEDEEDYNASRGKRVRHDETCSPHQPTGHITLIFSRSPALPISGSPAMPPSTLPAIRSNADENSDRQLRKSGPKPDFHLHHVLSRTFI